MLFDYIVIKLLINNKEVKKKFFWRKNKDRFLNN